METIDGDTVSSRRSNKPLVEKRRRERINKSLEELKSLVLGAMNKDSSEFAKMEKADILEMTVNHMRAVRNHPYSRTNIVSGATVKYRAGFSECASEVVRYLSSFGGMDSPMKARLLDHLNNAADRTTPSIQVFPSAMPSVAAPSIAMPMTSMSHEATHLTSLPGSSSRSMTADAMTSTIRRPKSHPLPTCTLSSPYEVTSPTRLTSSPNSSQSERSMSPDYSYDPHLSDSSSDERYSTQSLSPLPRMSPQEHVKPTSTKSHQEPVYFVSQDCMKSTFMTSPKHVSSRMSPEYCQTRQSPAEYYEQSMPQDLSQDSKPRQNLWRPW